MLGIMSELNFPSVANRFLTELDKYQKDEMARGSSRDGDAKYAMLSSGRDASGSPTHARRLDASYWPRWFTGMAARAASSNRPIASLSRDFCFQSPPTQLSICL